jgi:thioredoxin-dependent adenylylsulfate APS reductase
MILSPAFAAPFAGPVAAASSIQVSWQARRNGSSFTTPLPRPSVLCGGLRVAAPRPRFGAASLRSAVDYDKLGEEWSASGEMSPAEIIDYAFTNFSGEAAIAFSGAEDVVLLEYASRIGKPYRVFALDTGRLHPETYRFYAEVEKHYGIRIEYTFPDSNEVTDMVNEKGLFSFYIDGHQECCRARKVRPLRQKLGTLRAWITGQRKDQSPSTRNTVPLVQLDPAFKGVVNGAPGEGDLVKFNPLAEVSSADVWATIRAVEVPYNALHLAGYISIGCEPCTRPVLPNQHEREGRWWWEEATQKECGLHKGNISADAAAFEQADDFVADAAAAASVVVFTKAGCRYCVAVTNLFDGLGVSYDEHVISEMSNYSDIAAALERATGLATAPNVFIGGKHIGGNDDVQKLHEGGGLKPLLLEAGVGVPITA